MLAVLLYQCCQIQAQSADEGAMEKANRPNPDPCNRFLFPLLFCGLADNGVTFPSGGKWDACKTEALQQADAERVLTGV